MRGWHFAVAFWIGGFLVGFGLSGMLNNHKDAIVEIDNSAQQPCYAIPPVSGVNRFVITMDGKIQFDTNGVNIVRR